MSRRTSFLVLLFAALALVARPPTLRAQTVLDPNEGARLASDPTTPGGHTLSWWGKAGRTYFLQQNDDLLNRSWPYLPVIEPGADRIIQWGFTSSAPKFFLRLVYTDIPTSDPFNNDFDSDGVSNWDELLQGTNPLFAALDPANGLPLDWEQFYFGHTGVDPNALAPRGDGLTNLQAFQHRLNPLDIFNGQTPVLTIVSGDNQAGLPRAQVPQALVVGVTDLRGTPLAGVSVSFTAAAGTLATQSGGSGQQATILTVRADATGRASVYLTLPSAVGQVAISAVSGPSEHTTRATLKAAVVNINGGSGGSGVVDTSDLDGSGLADWWEIKYFGAIGQNPNADPDGDGMTNRQEYEAGYYDAQNSRWVGPDPTKADTDNDGVPDGLDGWANEPAWSPPRLPQSRYVVVPLSSFGFDESFSPFQFNNALQVLATRIESVVRNGSTWTGYHHAVLWQPGGGSTAAPSLVDVPVLSAEIDISPSNPGATEPGTPRDPLFSGLAERRVLNNQGLVCGAVRDVNSPVTGPTWRAATWDAQSGQTRFLASRTGGLPDGVQQEGASERAFAISDSGAVAGIGNFGGATYEVYADGSRDPYEYFNTIQAQLWPGGAASAAGQIIPLGDPYRSEYGHTPSPYATPVFTPEYIPWRTAANAVVFQSLSTVNTTGTVLGQAYQYSPGGGFVDVLFKSSQPQQPANTPDPSFSIFDLNDGDGSVNHPPVAVGERRTQDPSGNLVTLPQIFLPPAGGSGIWTSKDLSVGPAGAAAPASAGLGSISRVNRRGELLGTPRFSGTLSLARNGRAVNLDAQVGAGGWQSIHPIDLNDQGAILASALSATGPFQSVLLLPMELVTRDPVDGVERPVADVAGLSHPIPTVRLVIGQAQLAANGSLQVSVSGTVSDALSEFADDASQRVQNITFSVNGQTLETMPLSAGPGTPPWRPHSFVTSFQKTFTIPAASAQAYVLHAETSANAAGNVGWAEAVVSIQAQAVPTASGATGENIQIAFPQTPSDTVADAAQVFLGANPTAQDGTVAEDAGAPGSYVFTGRIYAGGALRTCELRVVRPAAGFTPNKVDEFDARISYSLADGTARTTCAHYRETAVASGRFVPVAFLPDDGPIQTQLNVGYVSALGASPEGDFQPLLWRMRLPQSWAEGQNASVTGSVNGAAGQKLKAFDLSDDPFGGTNSGGGTTNSGGGTNAAAANSSTGPAPQGANPISGSGTKTYYLVKTGLEDRPRIFVVTAERLPAGINYLTPDNLEVSEQDGELKVSLNVSGKEVPGAKVTLLQDNYGGSPPTGIRAWFGQTLTADVLLTNFKLLYGDLGQRLLYYYQLGGNRIELKHEFFGGKLATSYWRFGGDDKFAIRIDDKVNPVEGAQLLWSGLQTSLPYQPVISNIPVEDLVLQDAVRQQIGQEALKTGIAAANVYLNGLRIANQGADLAITINDLLEGHWSAAIGIAPYIPKGATLYIKNASGQIFASFGENLLAKLKPIRGLLSGRKLSAVERIDAMENIRGLLATGEMTVAEVQTLINAGKIPIFTEETCRRNLRQLLGPKPANLVKAEAHHDLPCFLQDRFLEYGLDINNPQFGRWVEGTPPGLHQVWTSKFNDEWRAFFAGNVTTESIITKMNELRVDDRFQ